MTGPEAAIGAAAAKGLDTAAKGVGQAASEVLGEEPSIKVAVAEKAKESTGVQKAAELRGQRAAVRQAVVLQLWKPIARLVGVSSEYFNEGGGFAGDMASKLQDIPEEELITPPANVAVPAMQGLGLSLDQPDLKEMYLQLLAKASNNATSGFAHPSFAQIIRELQPEEAALLRALLTNSSRHAIVQVQDQADDGTGYIIVQNHVLPFADSATGRPAEEPSASVWIDNWARLGLVATSYDSYLSAPDAYNWVEDRPEMAAARRNCASGRTTNFQRGILDATDFGKRFAEVVFFEKSG